jgi:predicted permease
MSPSPLRRIFRLPPSRASLEREIEHELKFHLESRVNALMASGLGREEAETVALREFGDVSRARVELAVIDRRRLGRDRRWEILASLWQDLRLGVRLLVTSPSFALIAIVTLALGIGATSAIFSGVDAVLLRRLPFGDVDRLVGVWLNGREGAWVAPGTYRVLRERSSSMDLGAWSGWSFTVTGDGEAESVDGARISTNLFALLGAPPLLGRTFVEADAEPWATFTYAGGSAVILSHGFWQRRYGGDPDIVGRTIMIDGMAVPVVGVQPADFTFPDPEAEMWLPVALDPAEAPGEGGFLRLVGRLRQDRTMQDARADLGSLIQRFQEERPDRFTEAFGREAVIYPLRDDLVGATKRTLLLLFGAVGFVLLIACANVANLFLARATVREREMSIRAALGAGRLRLVRQALTEHLALALCGAAVGLALAYWGSGLLARALPAGLTRGGEIAVSGRVVAFTVALTVLTALFSGLVPALRTSRGGSSRSGESGARSGVSRERRRLLESLVVGELAIALVLSVGAGLMLQSFWRLVREDSGFRAEGVLTFRAAAPEAFYPRPEQRDQLTRTIIERARALPGVTNAGAVHLLPLGGGNWSNGLTVEGRPLADGQVAPDVDWRVATPEYFATAGIPLLAGRAFTSQDAVDAPGVALVNETLAREIFPGESALGRRVRTGFERGEWMTIVGVVADTRDTQLRGAVSPKLYRPHAQYALGAMTYMIRTGGQPMELARAVRAIVAEVDPNVPVSDVQQLEDVVTASVSQPRLLALLLTGFGGVALLMAALGIYGVIAYAVGQRRREFGIRLALGARPSDVRSLVIRSGTRLAVLGLLVGLGGAWALTSFLRDTLYEVEPRDPITFLAVAALLGGIALLGSYLPARRAARVDPATTLSG